MIDLRSDTVTRPTPGMRQAMVRAEVGDDVFGDDPTASELERRAAELMGMDRALFMPSGTMANQVAIACHTHPGQEAIVEATSHIFEVELSMMARFSGVQARPLNGVAGAFSAAQVEEAIRASIYYLSSTGLICLESTHNAAGGQVWPACTIHEISTLAQTYGIPVHLDGARILNAQAATGTPARELVVGVDSVMFCLSKGLGCPIGSILCGSTPFIREARVVRKALGGGMRQVGILAAAGLYALDHHVERLAVDHENARLLASQLSQLPGVTVWPHATNIVVLELGSDCEYDAPELCGRLERKGILASPAAAGTDPQRVRFVTHLGVNQADIRQTVERLAAELSARS